MSLEQQFLNALHTAIRDLLEKRQALSDDVAETMLWIRKTERMLANMAKEPVATEDYWQVRMTMNEIREVIQEKEKLVNALLAEMEKTDEQIAKLERELTVFERKMYA